MKTCRNCNLDKAEGEFYSPSRFTCRVCTILRSRNWATNNREARLRHQRNANRKLLAKHPEYFKLASRKYRKLNRQKALEATRTWRKANPKYEENRRKTDPEFKLLCTLRSRLSHIFDTGGPKKAEATRILLGCPLWHLKAHFDFLFGPGMTWRNHGTVWEIDHIKPCAAFDFSYPEQQRACFHWTNLQPLFVIENRHKSAT